jgi:hypothetical protein
MPTTVKQITIVRPGGVVEVRSPELHEGEQAEVTVVVNGPAQVATQSSAGGWRRFAGAFKSNDSRGGDNQRIDAELADEFGGSKAGS